jgi:8-oxo-dGTP pyrophosphatase MutT (NUDIX family)
VSASPPEAALSPALHDDALRQLRAWSAPTHEQDRLRRDYVEHLERHADALSRSGPPQHLTGSALVVDGSGENVLLTHHPKAGLWLQFGGHFEPEDLSLWHGAAREAREESGIADLTVLPHIVELNRHDLSAAFGRCRQHLDVRYVAVAPAGARHAVSEESLDVRWWPASDLPPGAPDDLVPLVRAARALTRR